MLAEWSAECSAEDPVVVVPWQDPSGKSAFIDLRANPSDLDSISEAEQHPPLMQALRALNAPRSPVFTAKCDAWPLSCEDLKQLELNLDSSLVDSPLAQTFGFASYIDLVWRERSIFTSWPEHERILRRLTRLAAPLDHPAAALDCVLRPALIDLDGAREGYAVSLYIKALGRDPHSAQIAWAAALDDAVALLRARDLTR
jgi:hypothetical protein